MKRGAVGRTRVQTSSLSPSQHSSFDPSFFIDANVVASARLDKGSRLGKVVLAKRTVRPVHVVAVPEPHKLVRRRRIRQKIFGVGVAQCGHPVRKFSVLGRG